MKIKILNLLIASLFILSTISCTNLLEDVNNDAIAENSETLKDLGFLERLALNMYETNPAPNEAYIQSMMTDEVKIATTNNGSGVFLYGRTFTSQDGDVETLWQKSYRTIFTANKILDNIDNVTSNSVTIGGSSPYTVTKNQLKSEALGMRAFCHFILLKNFSPRYSSNALGCAYMKSANVENIFDTPARDNMQVSYQNVLNDLNAAETLNGFSTLYNKRMNLATVRALKAMVYLEMDDFPNAILNSNLALSGKSLKTNATDILTLWTDPITSSGLNTAFDASEILFQQINIQGSVAFSMGALYRTPSLGVYWNVSNTLKFKFVNTDYRLPAYFRSSNTVYNKYYGPSTAPGVANVKIIRTAGLYLVRAEAKAKNGDLAGAFTDYSFVRTARNAGTSVAFANLQDAINKILDEKARELTLEGNRMTDLKRNGKVVQRVSSDATTAYPNTSFPDVDKMTLPIPYSEMFANGNMQQNVGW